VSAPKRKTAKEFVEELERDPVYRERRAAREAETAKRAVEAVQDEASLVRELGIAGVSVDSVYDFVNDVVTPLQAVPVLLRHLDVPHIPAIREGLLRSLAYSHLRPSALDRLKDLFRAAPEPGERWLIANSIAAMATLKEVADLPGVNEYAKLFKRTPRKQRGKR